MGHTYLEVYYHIVWGTKNRDPLIDGLVERMLFSYLRRRAGELGVTVHALNGMPDHVHLACSIPPRLSVADFMEIAKGASSHYINHSAGGELKLYWQAGYGVLTFAKRDLPGIVGYIRNQKEHHQQGSVSAKMERYEE